jgi:hypothetical protein
MKKYTIGLFILTIMFVSCGDPSRNAAREAAELERGRIIDVPRTGQDTTISKAAGGGTGVGNFKADTIIAKNRNELIERF